MTNEEYWLDIKAKEIASKYGCTDWQGLVIAVQMKKNSILEGYLSTIANKL